MLLSGCGVSNKVIVQPSVADLSVAEHIENGDITGMLHDYVMYPEKRGSLNDYLQNEVNWDRYSYDNLLDYLQVASPDSTLSSIVTGILEDRQEAVISFLSTCSYQEMGDYYRRHAAERSFIRDFVIEALSPELQDADYLLVRHLHRCFQNTDISPEIDEVWREKRMAFLPGVESGLSEYAEREDALVDYQMSVCFDEIKAMVDDVFPALMEDCLKEVENGVLDLLIVRVKATDEPLADRIEEKVHSSITDSMVSEIISQNIEKLVEEVNNARALAAIGLTFDEDLAVSPFKYPTGGFTYYNTRVPKRLPNIIESFVEKTRKRQNTLSLISTATTFIPGVGWGVKAAKGVLDGADLLYGITSTVKEQQEVNAFIQQFSDELYNSEMRQIAAECQRIFNGVKTEMIVSRTLFTKEVYEVL